jgi:RimJ/RimL family protein N-acetyltransferase
MEPGVPESMRSMIIREAMAEDAQAIAEVHVLSWQAAYLGVLPQALLDGLSVERRAARWSDVIGTEDTQTFVATRGPHGQVVGFISVGPSRDDDGDSTVGELRAVYLRPETWYAGVGTQLHDAAMSALGQAYERATLWVLDGNARARAFYERHDWRPDGTTKDEQFEGASLLEVRYRRSLRART